MTELTEQQKIERIRTRVMGHRKVLIEGTESCFDWYSGNIRVGNQFNPFRSWDAAGMLLEKIKEMPEKIQEIFSQEIHERVGRPLYPMPVANLTPAIIAEAALATLEER